MSISEFRVRGPNGATDEFVELYNTTNNDINVNTPDGSAGWTLAALAADGTAITTPFTIPIDTIIPTHGHYLAINSAGYSLSARASADLTYTADLDDNTGLALFRTADPAHFDLADRLDAAGFNAAGFNAGGAAERAPMVKLSARSSSWRASNKASAYAKRGATATDLFREGAWACENRLVLGQVKGTEKSNERTALPELLRAVALTGCIVTIDALECQREIAEQIVAGEAAYVLALKGKQGTLHQAGADYFRWAEPLGFKELAHTFSATLEKAHGRIEERRCWATSDIAWLEQKGAWPGLQSIVLGAAEPK